MLTEICAEVRNYFCKDVDKHFGEFAISGGNISPADYLKEGQYFRVVGSVFNDGIWKYPATQMKSEEFSGAVWAMSVPPAFIALADEIKTYQETDAAKPSAYTSESFGGYSYTRASNSTGAAAGWQAIFANRLNAWRKMHV